ncbi:MAG TPA: hypothetical protein EYP58_04600 [bacterium (Candidatus Stahlbacteria)]|nr:hypothetical protein [Candidatus Stahlbacteria bacterium]
MVGSAQKRTIYKVLKGITPEEVGFLTDGRKEILYEVNLTGEIMAQLIPEFSPSLDLVVPRYCPCCSQPWPKGRPIPEGVTLIIKDEVKKTYSGIIIDASAFKFEPPLFLRIRDKSGHLIYSLSFAERDQVVMNGLVSYLAGDDHLLTHDRVGSRPLRIRALNFIDGDLVISDRDGRLMHGSKHNIELMRQCRVVVIRQP